VTEEGYFVYQRKYVVPGFWRLLLIAGDRQNMIEKPR
jgi:hypothetical protein